MTDKPIDEELERLTKEIIAVLKTVYDPEIPVNIYDLGLIYDIAIDAERNVHIKMTLTAPACPFAQTFPGMVHDQVATITELNHIEIELVWEPPWTPQRMSEAARVELGWF